MATVLDSPLVGKKYVGLKTCEMHIDQAIVVYQGRACPLCLALDDADNARASERRMQDELEELRLEGPCQ